MPGLDSAGDLLIADNGIDGTHTVNELSADTIDEIPANMVGQQIYDFGFRDSYTDCDTGQRINGGPNAVPPLVAITPVLDSSGIPTNCDGASAMACLPAGAFTFVGSKGGVIVSCNGNQGAAGLANTDNAVVYYDISSGALIPILDGGNPGVVCVAFVSFSGSFSALPLESSRGPPHLLRGILNLAAVPPESVC